MSAASERVTHELPPVYDEKSAVLVLGTMPSPASRARGFYYSHPQNRFWPVMAALFGEAEPRLPEE
ncbi:MAG TPA: DNA-deoxyinosine glycosylase, partial [Oscillospiraceae bacterium]|nr:DNA-deoxyinosine glycosylase [Oscillospiraceae bacterium]